MVFVVLTSWVGDFECVNTGSGVIMLHYQPWVATIGNKVYTRSNPKSRKRMDEVRTSVGFEKLEGMHGLHRSLLLLPMAAPRAPSPVCQLWGRQRRECVCWTRRPRVGRCLVEASPRGGKFRREREENRAALPANPPGQSCRTCVEQEQTSDKNGADTIFFFSLKATHRKESRDMTPSRSVISRLPPSKYDIGQQK